MANVTEASREPGNLLSKASCSSFRRYLAPSQLPPLITSSQLEFPSQEAASQTRSFVCTFEHCEQILTFHNKRIENDAHAHFCNSLKTTTFKNAVF